MRWHNGRSRRSRNLQPENARKRRETRKDEGAAHSIQARRSLLQQRPDTFSQTFPVIPFFACKTAADHTFRVADHSGTAATHSGACDSSVGIMRSGGRVPDADDSCDKCPGWTPGHLRFVGRIDATARAGSGSAREQAVPGGGHSTVTATVAVCALPDPPDGVAVTVMV
jgi:hypothetical protein